MKRDDVAHKTTLRISENPGCGYGKLLL